MLRAPPICMPPLHPSAGEAEPLVVHQLPWQVSGPELHGSYYCKGFDAQLVCILAGLGKTRDTT